MAEKGKIKVIKDGTGGIVTDRNGNDLEFIQHNHKELCLNVGDEVKFDTITVKLGTAPIAANVERITAGTIVNVDGLGMGIIEERRTMKRINFHQPFAAEAGIRAGEVVKYNLICTDKGELAVNLSGVGE